MDFRYNQSVHDRVIAPVRLLRGSGSVAPVLFAVVLLSLLTACSWFSRRDGLAGVDSIPLSPVIRFSADLTGATIPYKNACGQPASLDVAGPLANGISRRFGRVFTSVTTESVNRSENNPEGTIDLALGIQQVDLAIFSQTKKSYPATVTLGLDATFLSDDGTVLFAKKIQSSGRGEVDVAGTTCDVKGIEKIAQEAIDLVSEGMAKQLAESVRIRDFAERRPSGGMRAVAVPAPAPREASGLLPQSAAPSQVAGVPTVPVPDPSRQGGVAGDQAVQATPLTFRAIVRDENRDHILQQEESLTIEVEVKNDGVTEVKGVEVVIGGTSALTEQLPPALSVGDLQPGEIKRVATTNPIAALKEPLRGELVLSLKTASLGQPLPPAKKVTVPVKPGKAEDVGADLDIDQPPKALAALRQQKVLVVAIGVGRFRDDQVPLVKYAGRDAEIVAGYFKTLGGVPDDRVRVLVDTHALKQDIVEVFEEWLPKRVDAATVVLVFFSGRAVVDGVTGAVSLMPFDGSPTAVGRLYSVRRLQESVGRLLAQRVIVMTDVSVEPLPGADPSVGVVPNWDNGLGGKKDQIMWMVGNRNVQEAHAYERGRHGLFTYHLLKGLQGAADVDRDGTVVAGELCTYAGGRVSQVAREQFGNEQEPLCVPPAGQGALVRMQPLAKGNNPKPAPTVKKEEPLAPSAQPPQAPGMSVGP